MYVGANGRSITRINEPKLKSFRMNSDSKVKIKNNGMGWLFEERLSISLTLLMIGQVTIYTKKTINICMRKNCLPL